MDPISYMSIGMLEFFGPIAIMLDCQMKPTALLLNEPVGMIARGEVKINVEVMGVAPGECFRV